jgi:hypothetical protein
MTRLILNEHNQLYNFINLKMHKNAYSAKTLNGNWLENRYTEEYDAFDNATSNTYLPNPCKCIRLNDTDSIQQVRADIAGLWRLEGV